MISVHLNQSKDKYSDWSFPTLNRGLPIPELVQATTVLKDTEEELSMAPLSKISSYNDHCR